MREAQNVLGRLIFHDYRLAIARVGTYYDGTSCVRALIDPAPMDDTDLFATLTICLGMKLKPGEFLVKTWSENGPITDALLKAGIFIDTGKRVPTGFVKASIWKLPK